MTAEQQRLLQAVEHFQKQTRGAELPEGVADAIKALTESLGKPAPGHDTPGTREALKVAPGTKGTGEPMQRAAIGVDGASPGQREARTLSQQIQDAAEAAAAKK
jgi:hypothetical protein